MNRNQIPIVYVLLAVLLLCACVPTPSQETVVNRGDGYLTAAILQKAAAPYVYEAPAQWQETLTIRDKTVLIDAEIEIANKDTHPVWNVSETPFTAETVFSLLKTLYGNNLLLREQERSYSELLTDLFLAERGWYAGEDEDTGETIWVNYPEQQADIARIEALLAETPAEDTFAPLTENNLELPINAKYIQAGSKGFYVKCTQSSLNIGIGRKTIIQPEEWVMEGNAFTGEKPHTLEHISITKEEALKIGGKHPLLSLRPDLQPASAYRSRLLDENTFETLAEGYTIVYVSVPNNDIPLLQSDYADCGDLLAFADEDLKELYHAPIQQESLVLFVADHEVVSLLWMYPKTLAFTVNENVSLLPFESVQERIRNHFIYGLGDTHGGIVTIKSIILTNALQRLPNQQKESILFPVWAIIVEIDRGPGQVSSCMYMMNAVDGSFVPRYA